MSLGYIVSLVGVVWERRAVLASVGEGEVVEFVLVRGFLVVALVRDNGVSVAVVFVWGGSANEFQRV